MALVAGVDICRAGWFAVLVDFDTEILNEDHLLLPSFAMLGSLSPAPSFIAVDIPIGLLEHRREGGRDCDRLARKLLGPKRGSSIFSPPVRPALGCESFEEGREYGLNRQSFGILPRVREVDALMTPSLQTRIREAHPEVTFFVLDGFVPQEERKKSPGGRRSREDLLGRVFHQVEQGLAACPRRDVGTDDVLDAYALAWTAMRIFRGEAACLPDPPPQDERGLEMAIWY